MHFLKVLVLALISGVSIGQNAIIFQEDCQTTHQWQTSNKQLTITESSGKLIFENSSSQRQLALSLARFYDHQNATLTIDFAETPTSLGLIWGAKDDAYQVLQFLGGKEFQLSRYKEGSYSLIEKSTQNPSTIWTQLKIKKEGGKYLFFAGDQGILISSTSQEQGMLGFVLEPNTLVKITNAQITWDGKTINHVFGALEEREKKNLTKTVNSAYNDIAPVVTPGGQRLYFHRKDHPSNVGENNDDIWYSDLNADSSWSNAKRASETINDKNHNHIGTALKDINTYFLTKQFSGEGKSIDDQYLITKMKGEKFGTPKKQKIKGYENEWPFINACMSSDGKVMILTLKNQESVGSSDLYYSIKEGSKWGKPVPLPKTVNTKGTEMTPFLAPDNRTLYFSSDGHAGYGSSDIFITKRQGSQWNSWSKPLNLGPYVNSSFWDGYFSVSEAQNIGYLSSHENSIGKLDIFQIDLPQEKNVMDGIIVKGVTYDSTTMLPMGAEITLRDLYTDSVLAVFRSDSETGYYEKKLKAGIHYELFAEQSPYNGDKEQVNTLLVRGSKEYIRDLYLKKFTPGLKIELDRLYFYQSKPDLLPECYYIVDELVEIMNEHPDIKVLIEGHTDNQGSKEINLKLSNDRTEAIREMLIERGVAKRRLKIKGYGESRPIASNKEEETRRLNRRVEFRIIN